MKKGISLVSLIITIIAIIILAGITIFSSLKTIEQAQYTKNLAEYRNVCDYAKSISNNINGKLIQINLTGDTLATKEQINEMCLDSEDSQFTTQDAVLVDSINTAVKSNNPERGYHYITATQIEYGIDGIDEPSNLEKVKNNYIINFYYGIVIAKLSNTETRVSSSIK